MYIQKLLLVLIFLNGGSTTCQEGCLSCGSDNICNLCDTQHGFYLDSNTQFCVRSQQKNCQSFDYFGGCLVCVPGFYYDQNIQRCYQVSSSKYDNNCIQYDTEQQCVKCVKDHYLYNGQCVKVAKPINYCKVNITEEICGQCEDNYTLTLDQTMCIVNPNIDKCKAYTNIQCGLCPPGHQLSDNLSRYRIQDSKKQENRFNLFSLVETLSKDSIQAEDNCHLGKITYCKRYGDFQVCEQCHVGYELYNGKCYRPSSQIIQNCAYKSDADKCMQCNQGYYLRSPYNCEKIGSKQLINHCQEYDPSTYQVKCIKCENDYFLQDKKCLKRNVIISGCMSYSEDAETCKECQADKVLSTDKLQCFDKIDNCLEYEDIYSGDTKLVCSKCTHGHYLKDELCVEGTVNYCFEYKLNEDVCVKCIKNYYLSLGVCLLHTNPVDNCEIQGQSTLNTCEKCENGYKDMDAEVLCFSSTFDPCKVYESEGVCGQCNEGYKQEGDGCVLKEPEAQSSINVQDNTSNQQNPISSIQCNDGQFEKKGNCISIFEYEAQNCDQINSDIQSNELLDQECQICSQDTIPYNLKDHYSCVSQTDLQSIYNSGSVLVDKCIAYQNNQAQDAIVCKQCEEGYVLQTSDNTCTNVCSMNQALFNQYFTLEQGQIIYSKTSICVNEIQEASTLVQDQDFVATSYDLKSGYQYEMELQRTDGQYKLVQPNQVPGTTTSTDMFQLPMHKSILQLDSQDIVTDCMFYADVGNSQYECQVCKFGYFSQITNIADTIDNCHQYGNDYLCDICIYGYKLKDDRTECTDARVQQCSQYESNTANCLLCNDNYYRQDLKTCTPNNITNCEIKNRFKNTCLKCNNGYYSQKDVNGDILQCILMIDYCTSHIYTQDTLKCIECNLGYYPDANKTQCIQGTVTGCIEYDQTQINQCMFYDNDIEIVQDTQCVDIPVIFGCAIQNSNNTQCEHCQIDKYYYSNEGLCCSAGKYPVDGDTNTNDCTGSDGQCKKWEWSVNQYICSECQDNYQLDPITRKCCNIGQQVINGNCVDSVPFNPSNILDCALYDFNNRICLGCVDTKYLSLGRCCDLGQYNNNGTCQSISIPNCDQLSNDLTSCQSCQTNYFLQENNCCNITSEVYSYDQNKCINKPTNMNCGIFESNKNNNPTLTCQTCKDDSYFMVENNIGCCLKATDNFIGQFWNQTLNSGQGGCQDIDATNKIDDCEIYDNNQKCIECQIVNSIQLYSSNGLQCCAEQLTFAYDNCTSTDSIYDNCKSVNKSIDDFCDDCEDNFYRSNNFCVPNGTYFPVTSPPQDYTDPTFQKIADMDDIQVSDQCLQLSDDKTQCMLCSEGYRKVSYDDLECCLNTQYYDQSTKQCKDVETFNDDFCLLFNQDTNLCLTGEINDLYNQGMCQKVNDDLQYYILDNQTVCCPYGQHEQNDQCVANNSRCLIQYDNECKQCENGYILISNNCEAKIVNCEIVNEDNTQCQKCKQDYQLQIDGTTSNCVHLSQVSSKQQCSIVLLSDLTCTDCFDGYYVTNQNCCLYGFYYDISSSQCEKINKENCSILDLNLCNECFIDTQNCYTYSNISYHLQPVDTQISFQEQQVDVPIGFKDQFEIQEDNCCKDNQYISYGICVDIDANLNCLQGIQNDQGEFICQICKDNYYSSSGVCCKVTQVYDNTFNQCFDDNKTCSDRYYKLDSTDEQDKLYESNGQCCRQYHYYNIQLSQCMPHPDPNCKQSDSQYTCNQCIDDTYEVSQFYIKSILKFENSLQCEDRSDTYYFQPCVKKIDNNINTIDNDVQETYLENCQFDIDSNCTKCKPGYYLRNSYCCSEDEFHRDSICINKNVALNKCLEFDTQINKCKLCDTGYHLSESVCCQDGYEFNNNKKLCEQVTNNCKLYNSNLGICVECKANYYLLENLCCQLGTYHNLDNNTCIPYDDSNIKYCQKGTQSTCYECAETGIVEGTEQNIYETNGKCCQEGQYYDYINTKTCVNIPQDLNCLQLNNSLDCSVCGTDKYIGQLSSQCCPYNKYFDGTMCSDLNIECKKGYLEDGKVKCNECNSGYVLTNKQCCSVGYAYNWTLGKCLSQTEQNAGSLVNCLIPKKEVDPIDGNLYCEVCHEEGDYYLTDQVVLRTDGFDNLKRTVCCPYQYAFDYINQKCEPLDNYSVFAKNRYMLKNVDHCKKAFTFIKDGLQYGFCFGCVPDNQAIAIEKDTLTFDEQGDAQGNPRVNCYNDNETTCSAFYSMKQNILGCLFCDEPTKQYLGVKTCCDRGTTDQAVLIEQITNNSVTCVAEASPSNCSYFEGTECKKCITGYYLKDLVCVAELVNDANNCLRTDTSDVCIRCAKGYYITSTNTCLPIESNNPALNNCSGDLNQNCIQCFDGLILTNDACCQIGQQFDTDIQKCVNLQVPENCLQIQNNTCMECNNANDSYLIQNSIGSNWCCPSGQIVQGTTCVVPLDGSYLLECNVFENDTTCRILTDEEKINNPSLQNDCKQNGYYVTNGACCSIGQTFQNGSCIPLADANLVPNDPNTSLSLLSNCAKINEQNNCILCMDVTQYYVSNGICCNYGYYFNGTSCTQIDNTLYPNCNQFQSQCTHCTSGTLQNGCCNVNSSNIGTQCVQNLSNCFQMLNTTQCQQCQDNYYLINSNCCTDNQVYMDSQCKDLLTQFPQLTDCLQVDDFTDPNNVQCKKCATSKSLSNGRCCNYDQYFDVTLNKCLSLDVLDTCAYIDNDFSCEVCDSDAYFSSNQCCVDQQYFNASLGSCQNIDDSGCAQKDEGQRCEKCSDGFYKVLDNHSTNECCLYGMPYTATDCQTKDTDISIDNCTNFDNSDNCTQCSNDSTLQNNTCCPVGNVLIGNDNTLQQCIDIDLLKSNCLNFNTLTLLCDVCSDNYYRYEQQYLCCYLGQHYDNDTKTCIANQPLCQKQIDDDCQVCQSGSYLTGFGPSSQCCQLGEYLDITSATKTCKDITIPNCLQAIQNFAGEINCTLYDDICDNTTQVYDRKQQMCVNKIDNCDKHGYDENDNLICEQCLATYILSDNNLVCCLANKFYLDDHTCSSNLKISETNCGSIDNVNLECTSCTSQKYLVDGICCDYGKFKKVSDTIECTGDIKDDLNVQNCDIYTNGQCQKCNEGYQFNSSNVCVEIFENCSIFDAQNLKCLLCNNNLYITNDHCCPKNQKYLDNVCKVPDNSISNCEQYTDDVTLKCEICQNNYYNVNKEFCCPDGKYCSDQSTQQTGQVSQCKEYGTDDTNCTKCNDSYSLTQIKDDTSGMSVDYCLQYQYQNCLYSHILNVNNTNKIVCDQCDAGKELNTLSPQENVYTYDPDTNCLYYNIKITLDQSTLECMRCKDTHYLDNSGVCQQRTINYNNCIEKDQSKDECLECQFGYKLQPDKTCQQITLTNCDTPVSENLCGVCSNSYIPIGDTTNLSNYTCIQQSTIQDYTTIGDQIIDKTGILESCTLHTQCTDQYLNGLNPEISKYLSCHVCNDTSRIPFVQLKFDYTTENNNQLENGILISEYFDTNLQTQNRSSECFLSNLSEFGLADTTTYKFPDFCGVGIINGEEELSLNQTNSSNIDINTNKLSIFCGACKPGYKPVYSNINYHVIDCVAITNCNTYGSSFNQCDECNVDHAFLYDKVNQEIDKSQCVPVQQPQVNCYAYDLSTNKCQVCKTGYDFNIDQICENIQIPKCQAGKYNDNDTWELSDYQLAYYRGELGCQECQDGYYRLLRQIDDYVCLDSTYVDDNNFKNDNPNSYLVKDCKQYSNNGGNIKCIKCDETYLITSDNRCVPVNSNLNDCVTAFDENSCDTCKDNYYLDQDDICNLKDISNCLTYTNSQEAEECTKCEPLYYLDGVICTKGQINGCIEYIDQNNCKTCDTNYNIEVDLQGNRKCVAGIEDFICKEYDIVKFEQDVIECKECANGQAPKTLDSSSDYCFPLIKVEGCLIYDSNISDPKQVPNCLECYPEYYLEANKCIRRSFFDENCIEYFKNQDRCKECSPGYYPILQGEQCEKQLEEIQGCLLYKDNGECEVCGQDQYLFEQTCKQIDSEKKVQECYQYNSEQACINCKPSYILFEDKCQRSNVSDCEEFLDPNNCLKCKKGFIKKKGKKTTTCQFQKVNDNCRIMQEDYPDRCKTCREGYYPSENGENCQRVKDKNKIVKNCYIYNADQVCEQCEINYALTQDKKKCMPMKGYQRCLKYFELDEPICGLCQEGFNLNEDNQCEEDLTYIDNCLMLRDDDRSKCGICKPGYFMNNTYDCIEGNYPALVSE